jgi:hypothetical protein
MWAGHFLACMVQQAISSFSTAEKHSAGLSSHLSHPMRPSD